MALLPAEDADRVALGYRLQREHWGQGYATEGARLLLRLAFEQTSMQEIEAETMAVNLASRRVLERLGLRHVRTYYGDWADLIPGAEQGEVVYRLRRTDWPA
ncbi:MAG: GNAT family N-acetyltransferase [Deinococcus sp.]|nr:GNAT family N-acetyltransferase [Deinococcus sp.]